MRDQVAREVDRVALGAALAEPRQDLQDTRPRSGLVPVRVRLDPVAHRGDAASMKPPAHKAGLPPLPEPRFLEIAPDRRLAYHRVEGAAPAVLFCGGYTSDMTGTKALALERWCRAQGRGFVRFDYSGHGQSDRQLRGRHDRQLGRGCPGDRRRVTAGPLIVVGSSMGGWIMLLTALARPERVRALLGIAAAPDFTEDLLLPEATEAQRLRPRAPGLLDATLGLWRALSRDRGADRGWPKPPPAARPIAIDCPVHLLHGQRDPDVPWQTALRLAERLQSEDVTIELVKAGDHRLSSEADLARITAALARLSA